MTTTALAERQRAALDHTVDQTDAVQELQQALAIRMRQCELLAQGGVMPKRKEKGGSVIAWRKEEVFALWMVGEAHGISNPVEAARAFWVYNDRIEPASIFLHKKIEELYGEDALIPLEQTPTKVAALAKQKGWPQALRIEYTIEEAQKAKVTSNPVWAAHPKDMLWHTLVRKAAKQLFPRAYFGTLGFVSAKVESVLDAAGVTAQQLEQLTASVKALPMPDIEAEVQADDAAPDDAEIAEFTSAPSSATTEQSIAEASVTDSGTADDAAAISEHQSLELQVLTYVKEHPNGEMRKRLMTFAEGKSAELGDALEMVDVGILRDMLTEIQKETAKPVSTEEGKLF